VQLNQRASDNEMQNSVSASSTNRTTEQVVVFSIGEFTFAISAAAVQEIRNTDSLGGMVMELENVVVPKVRHIIERDSRSYFVVSGFDHFHLPQSRPTTLLILSKTPTAILVDRIEEMAEMRTIVTLPRSFIGQERIWYRGLTILDSKVVPVIDPKGFLTADELHRLEQSAAEHQETADSVHGGGDIS
jgi:chemotaxis signal transduction protein